MNSLFLVTYTSFASPVYTTNIAKTSHFEGYRGSFWCYTDWSGVLRHLSGMCNNIRTKWVCWDPDVEKPRAEAARHFPLALQWSSNDTSEIMVERRSMGGVQEGACQKWCASRMHYIRLLNPQCLKSCTEDTTFVCHSRKSIFHVCFIVSITSEWFLLLECSGVREKKIWSCTSH